MRISAIWGILMLSASSVSSAQVQPQSPLPSAEIRGLASRLLKGKGDARCKPLNCRILVNDITLPSGAPSRLGMQLADELASAFGTLLGSAEVVDRSRLRSYLDGARISADLLESDEAMLWLCKTLGATSTVVGEAANEHGKLHLAARLLSCDGKWSGKREEFSTTYDGDLSAVLAPLDSPSQSETMNAPLPEGVLRAGVDGVTQPRCNYCPPPGYTDEARAAKFQGTLIFEVVVTAEGRTTNITLVRGAPFGLNDRFAEAVRTWKFSPATKNGQPVAVQVQVETTLRSH
jgi:TonB family protein